MLSPEHRNVLPLIAEYLDQRSLVMLSRVNRRLNHLCDKFMYDAQCTQFIAYQCSEQNHVICLSLHQIKYQDISGVRLAAYRAGHMPIIKRLRQQYEITVGLKNEGFMRFSFTNNFDGGFALSHIARYISYLRHRGEYGKTFIEDQADLMAAAVVSENIKLVKMVIIKLKLFINKSMETTGVALGKIIEEYGSRIRHVLSAGWLEACKRGDTGIATLCINPLRNKRLKLSDSYVDRGMAFAIECGHMSIAKLIISMIPVDTRKRYVHPRVDTWFLTACGTGNIDMVYLFMRPQCVKTRIKWLN